MNKKLIVLIIIIIFGCCSYFGLKYYNEICEDYNNNITNFTIELIKGEKTVEEINLLNAPNSVKDKLIQYYDITFFDMDDNVILYNDISYYLKNKEKVVEIQKDYGESLLNEESPYFLASCSEDATEEEKKFFEFSHMYIDILSSKIDKRVIEKDNKIFIYAKDLNFNNQGLDIIYYKGFKFKINRESLEKSFIRDRKKSVYYKEITEIDRKIENKEMTLYYTNNYGSDIIIKYLLQKGKISDVSINIRL